MIKRLFGKRKRKKTTKKRSSRRLPERILAPVDEIVEQGQLVANVAVRMSVKNTIIMNALRRDIDYDAEEINAMVVEKLEELSAERIKDANHIKRIRDEVRKHGRSAWQETEYGNDDLRTLKHRQEVYESLASNLKAEAEDQDFVKATANVALTQAWEEIGDSLKDRAGHPYYGGGGTKEYKRERESRIQELIDGELQELIKSQKSARKFKPKTEK